MREAQTVSKLYDYVLNSIRKILLFYESEQSCIVAAEFLEGSYKFAKGLLGEVFINGILGSVVEYDYRHQIVFNIIIKTVPIGKT